MATVISSLGLNSFVQKHTPESNRSHFNSTFEELRDLVELEISKGNWKMSKDSDEVLIVTMTNVDRFMTPVTQLVENEEIEAIYAKRRSNELPYIHHIKYGNKIPASRVDVVVYSKDMLKHEASTTCDWEIVTIIACPDGDMENHMAPMTWARNNLGLIGGSDRKLGEKSKEELLEIIATMSKDIVYWNSHIMLTTPRIDAP